MEDFSNLRKAEPVKVEDLLELEKSVPETTYTAPIVISTKAAAGKTPKPLLSTFKGYQSQIDLIALLVPGWDIATKKTGGIVGYKKNGRVSIYSEKRKSRIFRPILGLFWDNYCELPNATGQSKFRDNGLGISPRQAVTSPKAENWERDENKDFDLINYEFPLPNSKIFLQKTDTVRNGAGEKIKFENGKVFSWSIIPKV